MFCASVIGMCRLHVIVFFFFKQKTAYEMRISDWSSDVCSSDVLPQPPGRCAWACVRDAGGGDGFRWRAGAGLAGVGGADRVRWQELAASAAPAGIARRHPYARPQPLAGAAEAASFPRAPPRNAPPASKQRTPHRQACLRPPLLAVVVLRQLRD